MLLLKNIHPLNRSIRIIRLAPMQHRLNKILQRVFDPKATTKVGSDRIAWPAEHPSLLLGPYPTSNPRMRQHGGSFLRFVYFYSLCFVIDFQPRGRFMHNRRGGHRPQNRFRQNFDQQSQASNNPDGQATTTYANNRGFNKYFRPSMLEDPWANMTPQKVPSNGTSLVFDTANWWKKTSLVTLNICSYLSLFSDHQRICMIVLFSVLDGFVEYKRLAAPSTSAGSKWQESCQLSLSIVKANAWHLALNQTARHSLSISKSGNNYRWENYLEFELAKRVHCRDRSRLSGSKASKTRMSLPTMISFNEGLTLNLTKMKIIVFFLFSMFWMKWKGKTNDGLFCVVSDSFLSFFLSFRNDESVPSAVLTCIVQK